MEILLIALVIGIIPAAIAAGKGHNFFAWYVFGVLLWIVALPCALLAKPNQRSLDRAKLESGESKKCPHCAEIIRREANVCRFCGRDL